MATERMCIHNSAIFCSDSRCSVKCGWNPKGAKARQKEIRTKGLTKREDGLKSLIVKSKTQNKEGGSDAN